MTSALYVLIGSVTAFVALSLLVTAERRRGGRLLLSDVRTRLDQLLERFQAWFSGAWDHFVQYVVKLGWYYSLHSLLRGIMTMLVAMYDYLERHLEVNRFRAIALREKKRAGNGNSHLQAVAEHKADVALTPEEQEKLREEKLEERD